MSEEKREWVLKWVRKVDDGDFFFSFPSTNDARSDMNATFQTWRRKERGSRVRIWKWGEKERGRKREKERKMGGKEKQIEKEKKEEKKRKREKILWWDLYDCWVWVFSFHIYIFGFDRSNEFSFPSRFFGLHFFHGWIVFNLFEVRVCSCCFTILRDKFVVVSSRQVLLKETYKWDLNCFFRLFFESCWSEDLLIFFHFQFYY